MKKNKMMRIASVLLIAVLMSTCAISGTFAKYVTEGSAADTARVAKWGVTVTGVTGDANEMFAMEYDSDTDDYTAGVTVQSTVNVVAPGTSGTFSNFSITGTPEVAVVINYDATLTLSGWAVPGDDFYCPIVITVGDTEVSGLGYNSASDFAAAVKAAVQAYSQTYAPGTDLRGEADENIVISWAWAFEGAGVINSYDTALGDAAAEGNASTIQLDVTATVTQVD